jgi:ribosomal protein S6--L-glutamate ligase
MKIHFLLDEQVHLQPCPAYVSAMALLADRDFTVSRGVPEAALLCPDRLCVRHDLYVLASRSELAMSVAAVLHDRGGQFLNPFPACALAQDRITAASRLAAAGVRVPRSWVTADFAMLCELAADRPVIVKPHRSGGRGKAIVARGPDDLAAIPLREQPVLVQEFIERRGPDLTLQGIGEQVFALEREAAAAVPLTAELREIALRCGRVFGLGLYGVEIVQGREGPVVVDFDRAPCLLGVPHAAALLARHIESVVGGHTPLQLHPPTLHVLPGWTGLLQPVAA